MSNDSCGPNDGNYASRLNQFDGNAHGRMFEDGSSGHGNCGRGSQGFGDRGFASAGNYQNFGDDDRGSFQHGGRRGEDEGRHGHGRWERDREEARLWRREQRERFHERFHHRGFADPQAALDNMDPAALYNYNGAQNASYDATGARTNPGAVSPDAALANNYAVSPNDGAATQGVPTGDQATQPQADSTILKIAQDAQSQLSASGFNSFANAVDNVLASGQATDDATVMQQVLAQLQQSGASPTDLAALQQIAQTDLAAAQTQPGDNTTAANQPTIDPTLAKIGQDAQTGMSADGFNAFAQQVQTDLQSGNAPADTASLMQQVVGELQQANTLSSTDMTALQGIVQQDLAAAQPTTDSTGTVDPTLAKIGQDAQSGMSADGFTKFAQQVQADLQSPNAPSDPASLMQQVLGELQQANTLSTTDMAALQGVIQQDLAAANPNPNPTLAPGDTGTGDPNATENTAGTTNNNGQVTVDAAVNQIGVDAQKTMTAAGFDAFVQQLSTDMQAGQATDDASLMQQVLTHLQQGGTMSQADLTALQTVMQTDLTAVANPTNTTAAPAT